MDKVVLGFAPTRRAIFSAPAAVVYRGLTAKRLKELNVDFVDIDDVMMKVFSMMTLEWKKSTKSLEMQK